MYKNLENLLQAEIDPAFARRARYIFEEVKKARPKKILDAGCGRGFYLRALGFFPFVHEIHGIDINEKYLDVAKKNCKDRRITIAKSRIYTLPYRDKNFDLIICSEVLEHLKDDKKALKELKRVLKKDGKLLITVPNKNFPFLWDPLNWLLMKFFNTHINKNIWWLAGIWADHEKLYSTTQLSQLLKESGFKLGHIEKILHWCWPFSHFLLYAIGKNLAERLNIRAVNRFELKQNNNISVFLSRLMRIPSKILDDRMKILSSVNIVVKARK